MDLTNFINGKFIKPINGKYIETYNPATGRVWGRVPDSNKDDVDHAVESAQLAFKSWSKTPRSQRSAIMMKIADLLEERLQEFAEAESKDQGKPVSLALAVDIPRAVYNFRFFAGRILYMHDTKTELDNASAMNYTQRSPVGVAGLISPWNLPLYLLTWKIAPCIAFGNTCVCKPSEMTSLTAWMLCQVLNDSGVPAGVVNMVFGNGPRCGEAIVSHPEVPLISFTGGTVTGQHVIKSSAPHYKKLSLELGGKNANIIFADADLKKAVSISVRSSFANQGEICLCGSRIFIHSSVYDEFVKEFIQQSKALVVGDPRDTKTTTGALISKEHLAKVQSYVTMAQQEGAQLLLGGETVQPLEFGSNEKLQGYFLQPTIIATKSTNCRIMQEEVFGPVVTVTPFNTETEAITFANSTKYGLSASVWTENGATQRRVAEQLDVGTVWVNCWMVRDLNVPFGGSKWSGIGREGADDSMDFFTESKTICLSN